MAELILVTGGARSGKSSFAETKAAELSEKVLYIATCESSDAEMAERIKKHQAMRPKSWKTLEKFENFNTLEQETDFLSAKVILLDCLSLLLNNKMFYKKLDFDAGEFQRYAAFEEEVLNEVRTLMEICHRNNKPLIIVTNEIGMGLVPASASSRYYRDMLGRTNKLAASLSDQVYLLISGIPIKIK